MIESMSTDERRVPLGVAMPSMSIAAKLNELSAFHNAMAKLCLDSEGGYETAKSNYHAGLSDAAATAASHYEAMS